MALKSPVPRCGVHAAWYVDEWAGGRETCARQRRMRLRARECLLWMQDCPTGSWQLLTAVLCLNNRETSSGVHIAEERKGGGERKQFLDGWV